MKANEHIVYRIINRDTGEFVPCFSWPATDQYDFNSVTAARKSNCHGIFEDNKKYKISKYKISMIENLLEDDVSEEYVPPIEKIYTNEERMLIDIFEKDMNRRIDREMESLL